MPGYYLVLKGERQEGRRERGEDKDVDKYVEMLTQGGFEVALSRSKISVLHPSLHDILLRGPSMLGGKRLYSHRMLEKPEDVTE